MYPDSVKKRIKKIVHVNTPEEASLVAKAMIEFSLPMYVLGDISPQQEKKVWDVFFENVEKHGPKYLYESSKIHWQKYKDSLFYIDTCLNCDGKLTRVVILGKVGLRCDSCGLSQPISPQGINPARLQLLHDPSLSSPVEPEKEWAEWPKWQE